MEGTARRVATAMALACCGVTATAGTEEARHPRVVLSIRNVANVSADVLALAGARVTRIYAAADIDILWHEADAPASAADLRLTIIITTRPPSWLSAGQAALGMAAEAEKGCGRVAWVLWDRLAAFARARGRAVEMVLGYVIAHEVGHLLLPPRSHAASGIMQALWVPRDLDNAERDRLRFTDEEAQQMRRRIATEPTLVASR